MSQTDESITMLNDIYQGASMGVQGTELLMGKLEQGSSEFAGVLQEYVSRYNSIKAKAAKQLAEKGETPRDAGSMEKTGQWMGVQMNTFLDKSASHMAEMLIQGGVMGIIEGEKQKNINPDADRKCMSIEKDFITLQQDLIEDMKKFLGSAQNRLNVLGAF